MEIRPISATTRTSSAPFSDYDDGWYGEPAHAPHAQADRSRSWCLRRIHRTGPQTERLQDVLRLRCSDRSRLGRPDIGLVSMSEVVETIGMIRDRVAAD